MVSQRQSRLEGHRRKFLAVVDDSPESARALRYAGMRAKNSANGGLVLLYVISDADFNQWIGVAEVMRAEAREEADAIMAKVAQDVRENIGHEPELVIREGKATDQIMQLIEEDRDIAILVLAASSGKDGPGPLVTAVAGRGMPFPIPVTIVPDTLTDEEIAALA